MAEDSTRQDRPTSVHNGCLMMNDDEVSNSIRIRIFYLLYFRPRRPLLRPHLVAVAEATWKNKKVHMYGKTIVLN